ncbi:hypothetical protein MASR2M12_06180 [Bacteroidales bacterium]
MQLFAILSANLTALKALTLPAPKRPGYKYSSIIGSAVDLIKCCISPGVKSGLIDLSKAQTPATIGDANEVPALFPKYGHSRAPQNVTFAPNNI